MSGGAMSKTGRIPKHKRLPAGAANELARRLDVGLYRRAHRLGDRQSVLRGRLDGPLSRRGGAMSKTGREPKHKRLPKWVLQEQADYQRIKAWTSAQRLEHLQRQRWPDRAKQASAVARVQRTGWGGQ